MRTLLIMVLLLVTGCASNYKVKQESTEKNVLSKVPAWFIDEQKKTNGLLFKKRNGYIFGVGSAVSASLQIAIDKATMQAKADLADQVRSYVNKTTEYAAQEQGSETSASLVTETGSLVTNKVVNINIAGYEMWKQEVFVTKAQQYRVYVGLKWTRSDENAVNALIPQDLLVGRSPPPEVMVETAKLP